MAFETQTGTDAGDASDQAQRLTGADRRAGFVALAVLVVVVALCQVLQGLNADTSWLLTVGDRWLDGARGYRDMLETNPPMSVLMFLPAVLLSRVTGVAAEPIVILAVAGLAFVTIEWSVRTLVAAGVCASPARTRLALGFTCLILPMSTFAERETIAVIALLPTWALMLIRAEHRPAARTAMLVAGFGAGLAMCIKPQFAAAILLPALVVARADRRFAALLQVEYVIAGLIVLAYGAVVVTLFPAYVETMLPLVTDLYRPVREPIDVIVSADVVRWLGLSLIGLWLMAGAELRQPRFAIPLLAGLGFALAVIEQSKGWAYHYYPVAAALAPAFLDAGIGVANERIGAAIAGRRLVIVIGFVVMAIGQMFTTLTFLGIQRPMQSLVGPIGRLANHPRMVAITPHLWVGHPLTRDIGGRWVGSMSDEWMTLGALYKLGKAPSTAAERDRLQAVIAQDRAIMAADIARGKPDLVIVEHDDRVFPAWFGSEAELAAFLPGYERASTELGILDLWVKRR